MLLATDSQKHVEFDATKGYPGEGPTERDYWHMQTHREEQKWEGWGNNMYEKPAKYPSVQNPIGMVRTHNIAGLRYGKENTAKTTLKE